MSNQPPFRKFDKDHLYTIAKKLEKMTHRYIRADAMTVPAERVKALCDFVIESIEKPPAASKTPKKGGVDITHAKLTRRQKDVLDIIIDFLEEGVTPSYREIAKKLNLKSHGSIRPMVLRLEELGYIERVGADKHIKLKGN